MLLFNEGGNGNELDWERKERQIMRKGDLETTQCFHMGGANWRFQSARTNGNESRFWRSRNQIQTKNCNWENDESRMSMRRDWKGERRETEKEWNRECDWKEKCLCMHIIKRKKNVNVNWMKNVNANCTICAWERGKFGFKCVFVKEKKKEEFKYVLRL